LTLNKPNIVVKSKTFEVKTKKKNFIIKKKKSALSEEQLLFKKLEKKLLESIFSEYNSFIIRSIDNPLFI